MLKYLKYFFLILYRKGLGRMLEKGAVVTGNGGRSKAHKSVVRRYLFCCPPVGSLWIVAERDFLNFLFLFMPFLGVILFQFNGPSLPRLFRKVPISRIRKNSPAVLVG